MRDTLEVATEGSTTLIAADEHGERLGFLHAKPSLDLVTGAPCGYVSLLAVVPEAENRGIARMLMSAAETWARERGYATLTLDVFSTNSRARAFYERLGFGEETLYLVKPLR